jgi:hypothetical protein
MTVTAAGEEPPVVQTVNFQEIINYLPQPPTGWDAGEPEGGSFSFGEGGTWSRAMLEYSRSGSEGVTAGVVIIDSAFQKIGEWQKWQGLDFYERPDGYAKTIEVMGYPAWEVYTKNGNMYSCFVNVNDRFFVFIYTNSDRDSLYKFVDAIDYPRIAALGGGMVPTAETPEPLHTPTTSATATPAEPGGETPGFELVLTVIGLLGVFALLKRRG